MAFGIELGGLTGKVLLTLFRIVVVIMGIYYLRTVVKPHFPSGALVALGLILGGAIGNIIDRIQYGAVIDFIDVHFFDFHWPAFNIADSAITIGVCFFLLDNFWKKSVKHDSVR